MEKFNQFEYIPRDRFKSTEEIINFRDTIGNLFSDSVSSFFKNVSVQQAVEDNDWPEVFSFWHRGKSYGNKPLWIDEMLCDLLYFLKVDFWNYFPSYESLRLTFNMDISKRFKEI